MTKYTMDAETLRKLAAQWLKENHGVEVDPNHLRLEIPMIGALRIEVSDVRQERTTGDALRSYIKRTTILTDRSQFSLYTTIMKHGLSGTESIRLMTDLGMFDWYKQAMKDFEHDANLSPLFRLRSERDLAGRPTTGSTAP